MRCKNLVITILLCTIWGLVFTFIVYQLPFPEKTERIFRYSTIVIGYFFFYKFLISNEKAKQIKSSYLIILSVIPSTIIDISVLFTAPSLAPLRVPFATIFPILGVFLGYSHSFLKKYFWYAFSGVALFLITSYLYLIPLIIAYMEEYEPSNFSYKKLLSSKFKNEFGEDISINDKAKCKLIDFFFVGCLPCEQKREEVLEKLSINVVDSNFIEYAICNGRITPFNAFVDYCEKHKKRKKNFVYLYDYSGAIDSTYKSNSLGYPYEVIFNTNNPIIAFTGFNLEAAPFNYKKRINLIKSILK